MPIKTLKNVEILTFIKIVVGGILVGLWVPNNCDG